MVYTVKKYPQSFMQHYCWQQLEANMNLLKALILILASIERATGLFHEEIP